MFEYQYGLIAAPLWVGAITFVAAGLISRRKQKDI